VVIRVVGVVDKVARWHGHARGLARSQVDVVPLVREHRPRGVLARRLPVSGPRPSAGCWLWLRRCGSSASPTRPPPAGVGYVADGCVQRAGSGTASATLLVRCARSIETPPLAVGRLERKQWCSELRNGVLRVSTRGVARKRCPRVMRKANARMSITAELVGDAFRGADEHVRVGLHGRKCTARTRVQNVAIEQARSECCSKAIKTTQRFFALCFVTLGDF
jgi:hypothetical protein